MSQIKIFHGNATPDLAKAVCALLNMTPGQATVSHFSDGETMVDILENVRGSDTFIIQSTCAPTNDHLMELIILADALRRASAMSITAVVPYYGYARQDRRVRSSRVPITAKVVADIIASVGISRLVTVDLHADQIQGFFAMPVDNVYGSPIVLEDMKAKKCQSPVVVSPDVGGVVRARAVAKLLNDSDLAIIDKRRPTHNRTEVMNIIGDVQGRECFIVDDIVDTGSTLCQGAAALKQKGAKAVYAYCTHPVLSGSAIDNIEQSELAEVVVTDTIPLSDRAKKCKKIRQLSLAPILAQTIYRVNHRESVSSMFVD